MNRFLAALALLLLAAVPAAAQTNVVWGLATGANPRNLCVYDSTHACVTTGTLDSTLHVFTPSVPNGTITSGMLAAGVAAANLGFTPLSPANNLSDLTSATTARTNLGLGTAAVANTGTSGATLCLLNGACTFATMPTFTAGQLPPASGGTGLSTFTRSGNTTDFATATGTLTSGHCVSIDANGNFIDAGGTCTTGGGGGTVTAGTVGQLAYYAGTTNTGSFALAGDCTFTYPNVTCTKTSGTVFSTLATLTPGTGVATALGSTLNAASGLVGYSGALGTPTSGTLTNATGLPISTGVSGAGTGVIAALGNTLNAASGLVGYSGALGTPTSGTLTNATGLPISTGVSGLGSGVATALAASLNAASGLVGYSGALGTPTSGTLTNATGLPISTGVSGLGANIPAALGTALNGTGALSATSNVTLITPNLGTPSTLVLTNATGLPLSTGVTGTLQAAQEPAHTGDVTNSAGALALTLATVNSNTGSFGGASSVPNFTVNAKGLVTAAGATPVIAPAGTLTGTLATSAEPAHTGDVTNSAGALALTIAANAVTNAKLATAAAGTIKSNITGSTAAPIDNSVSSVLDSLFGTTQGTIAYRGASNWAGLTPGAAGTVLSSNGSGANPSYVTASGSGSSALIAPCDGTTDLTAQLNAALAALPTNGGTIEFSAGKCKFASAITFSYPATAPFSLRFEGQGQGATQLYWPTNVTTSMTLNLSSPGHSLHVSDLSFTTGVAAGGTALYANNSVQLGAFMTSDIQRVGFLGDDGGISTDYWTIGLSIAGLSGIDMDSNLFIGDSSNVHGIGINNAGVSGGTNKYSIVLNVDKCQFYNLNVGINLGGYWQGIQVNNSTFTNGTKGILQTGSASGVLAQLSVSNSEFNTFGNLIETDTAIDQVALSNNLFFVYQSTNGVYGVNWLGGTITGNSFTYAGSAKTSQNGIIIGPTTNGQPTTIVGNTFQGQTTAIWLQSTSNGVTQALNSFNNNTTNSLNSASAACPASSSGNCVGTITP